MLVVLALVAAPGCDQIKKWTGQKKADKAADKAPKVKKKKVNEFASIDLVKIEKILLDSKHKKFKPWIAYLEEQYNQLMPGKKPLSLNTTRSRIRTWTPRGSFTQYALNLVGFVESNGKPGWQYNKEKPVFKFRIRHRGKNAYDLTLTGPDGKTASQGRKTLKRKTSVARFIRRKMKKRSGTYHTPEDRAKDLATKRGQAPPPKLPTPPKKK